MCHRDRVSETKSLENPGPHSSSSLNHDCLNSSVSITLVCLSIGSYTRIYLQPCKCLPNTIKEPVLPRASLLVTKIYLAFQPHRQRCNIQEGPE